MGACARAGSAHDFVSMVQPADAPGFGVVPPAADSVGADVVLVDVVETRGAVTRGVVGPVPPPPPQEISATAAVIKSDNDLLRPATPPTIAPTVAGRSVPPTATWQADHVDPSETT